MYICYMDFGDKSIGWKRPLHNESMWIPSTSTPSSSYYTPLVIIMYFTLNNYAH